VLVREEPQTIHWPFDPWPEVPEDGFEMEFRLVYDGSLPAASRDSTRNKDKSRIRRVLGKQLKELWETHPRLRERTEKKHAWQNRRGPNPDPSRGDKWSFMEMWSRKYSRCGRHFAPFVTERSGAACGLEILFLRRDNPGDLIKSGGGDIDNRIKVLFDALRMPQTCDEIDGDPKDDDDPFYCLLEDDRLITEVKITTDRLLTAVPDGGHINDVHMVIRVYTILIKTPFEANMWLS